MRYSGCDCLDIATHRALLASNCPSITLAMNVAVGLGMLSSTILSTHMIGMESTAPVMPPVRTIVAGTLGRMQPNSNSHVWITEHVPEDEREEHEDRVEVQTPPCPHEYFLR